jgi:hypothetical protein
MEKYKFIKVVDSIAIEDATSIEDFLSMDSSFIIAVPEENFDRLVKIIKFILDRCDDKIPGIHHAMEKYNAFEIGIDEEIYQN